MGGVKSEAVQVALEPVARPALYNPWVTFVGQVGYVCAVFLLYLFYKAVVPDRAMGWWLWITVPVCLMSIAFSSSLVWFRPPWEQFLKWWRPLDKSFTHLFDLVAVSAIFLLFPHGNESHRLVFLAFCVGYGPLQMIADPENATGTQISVVTILGSFSLALFLRDDPSKWILSGLIVIYGTVLILASSDLRNTALEAVRRRRQSDKDAKALAAALAEVSASRDAITRFIATASHDLGQPLMAAGLYARQLERPLAEPERSKALVSIQSAVSSAQGMAGHMMSYLRLEADAVKPMPASVSAWKIIDTVVEQETAQALVHSISLIAVRSSRILVTDASLVQRALSNLVNNAIVHSGGRRVLVGVRSAGRGQIRIWVIDDGRGIAADQAGKIFEDYYQVPDTENLRKGGFGLGLASVRRIATLLGGHAALDTRIQRGSAFFIELAV